MTTLKFEREDKVVGEVHGTWRSHQGCVWDGREMGLHEDKTKIPNQGRPELIFNYDLLYKC